MGYRIAVAIAPCEQPLKPGSPKPGMNSSRMRTVRCLLYGGGMGLCLGVSIQGVSVQGGLCPGQTLSRRVSVWGVSVRGFLSGRLPPPCGQTDTCENITLSQTSFAGGNDFTYQNVFPEYLACGDQVQRIVRYYNTVYDWLLDNAGRIPFQIFSRNVS